MLEEQETVTVMKVSSKSPENYNCSPYNKFQNKNFMRVPILIGCTQRGSYSAKGRVSAF